MKTRFLAAALAVGISFAGTTAGAAIIGYQLDINNPIFNTANGTANVPDFQLTNNSTSAQITRLELSHGNFGTLGWDFVRMETDEANFNIANGGVGSTSPLGISTGVGNPPNDSIIVQVLDISFTSFDPSDIFRFEADVDPGVPTDLSGLFTGPVASTLTVTFSNGGTLTRDLLTISPNAEGFTFRDSQEVPEPGALAILGFGLAGLGFLRRRKVA
jgi:hypothetical protein